MPEPRDAAESEAARLAQRDAAALNDALEAWRLICFYRGYYGFPGEPKRSWDRAKARHRKALN